MSGTRHHFIPQFLLRGFSQVTGRDACYTWMYPRNRAPFRTNVLNAAVEGHFYTHEGSSEVDDLITCAEGRFGGLVDQARKTGSVKSLPRTEVASLFVHFEVRTRHLRQTIEHIGAKVLQRTLAVLEDEELLARILLSKIQREPEFILREISREFEAQGFAPDAAAQLASALLPHAPSVLASTVPAAAKELTTAFRNFLVGNTDGLKATVRNAQLRALRDGVAPEARAAMYEHLEYSVISLPSASLPLGDSAVVAHVEAEQPFKTLLSSDDKLIATFLPLAPDRVLCGHVAGYEPSLIALPRAVVRCSLETFYFPERRVELEALQPEMGASAVPMSIEQIDRALSEALGEQIGGNAAPSAEA